VVFETVYVFKYCEFKDLKELLEEIISTYDKILVRFSISFLEIGQAVLWVNLRLDSDSNPNKIVTEIQNYIQRHKLTVTKIYELFKEEQSLILDLKKEYLNSCSSSFDIQSAGEVEKIFVSMAGNSGPNRLKMRYIKKIKDR